MCYQLWFTQVNILIDSSGMEDRRSVYVLLLFNPLLEGYWPLN